MDDLTMMQLAVAEDEKAAPKETWTNPRVGAVIVKNGVVLATGYHHQFGQVKLARAPMRLWQLGLVGLWLAKVTRIRWYMVKGLASCEMLGLPLMC